jgi:outer membrane protein assembly factor BamB
LSTASDLLFAGTYRLGNAGAPHAITDPAQVADGDFFAVDARTGQLLWKKRLGGDIRNGPMSYSVNGRQYIAVAAGNSLFAFTLPR